MPKGTGRSSLVGDPRSAPAAEAKASNATRGRYLYKGDGLIALWNWQEALRGNRILRAIAAVFASVSREEAAYLRQFGVVPRFRFGVHGGEVVVSEQGDTKRAIGVYGSTINIAARMEELAKARNVTCVISGDVDAGACRRR